MWHMLTLGYPHSARYSMKNRPSNAPDGKAGLVSSAVSPDHKSAARSSRVDKSPRGGPRSTLHASQASPVSAPQP